MAVFGYTRRMSVEQIEAARESHVDPKEEARQRRRTRGHVASFGGGRVCSAADCDTQLSRYNDSETCSVHEDD